MTRALALASAVIGILGAQLPPNPPQFIDLTPDFRGITLHSNGRVAWAAAKNGLIYRSTDSGSTWTPVDVPGSGALSAVRFMPDGKRGWAVGESRIAYTVDGGLTWAAS